MNSHPAVSGADISPEPLAQGDGGNRCGFGAQYPGAQGNGQKAAAFCQGNFFGGQATFRTDHQGDAGGFFEGVQGLFGAVV